MNIASSFADDNVETNDQVILPGIETETFWVISTHNNDYNEKSWQDQLKIFWLYRIAVSVRNGNLSF